MKATKIGWLIFLIIVFLAGVFAILSLGNSEISFQMIENMENPPPSTSPSPSPSSCPDMLIKQGNILLLYDSKQPIQNGINPITFANLDEYIKHIQKQRSSGQDCPVLYLQKENDAQGRDVFRIRPSPFDMQGGLPPIVPIPDPQADAMNNYLAGIGTETAPPPPPPPQLNVSNALDASRESSVYNKNQYAGFDPQGLYVGVYTNIDQLHDSTHTVPLSDNPMDANWAGVQYTNQSIASGKYADNNISKPLLFQPRGHFDPNIAGGLVPAPPQDIY